jgi:alpha-glucosidase (family GH31 glycosyl hydrolase)
MDKVTSIYPNLYAKGFYDGMRELVPLFAKNGAKLPIQGE